MTEIRVTGPNDDEPEPIYLADEPFLALVHPGEVNVEVVGEDFTTIGPEETLVVARNLEPEQWALIRENDTFKKAWALVWNDVVPPKHLCIGNLATRHIAGMILMMFQAVSEKRKIFLKLPETYLHPRQAMRLVSMVQFITGHPKNPK